MLAWTLKGCKRKAFSIFFATKLDQISPPCVWIKFPRDPPSGKPKKLHSLSSSGPFVQERVKVKQCHKGWDETSKNWHNAKWILLPPKIVILGKSAHYFQSIWLFFCKEHLLVEEQHQCLSFWQYEIGELERMFIVGWCLANWWIGELERITVDGWWLVNWWIRKNTNCWLMVGQTMAALWNCSEMKELKFGYWQNEVQSAKNWL